MNIELLTILISAIVTLTTTILGYYAGKRGERKKVEAEAEHSELDNVEKAITIWRKVAEDLMKEISVFKGKIDELETKIDNLEKTIEELKPFKDENKQLQKTINILRQQIKNNEK